MGPETLVTVVAVGVIVAAIALYLIGITLNLRKASLALRGVQRGVGAIHAQTEPVGQVLGEIAAETGTIAGALTALVAKATGAVEATAEPMQDAVARARSGEVAGPPPAAASPGSMQDAVARARVGTSAADAGAGRPIVASARPRRDERGTGRRRRRASQAGDARAGVEGGRTGIDLPSLEAAPGEGESMSAAVARAREAVASGGR